MSAAQAGEEIDILETDDFGVLAGGRWFSNCQGNATRSFVDRYRSYLDIIAYLAIASGWYMLWRRILSGADPAESFEDDWGEKQDASIIPAKKDTEKRGM